MDIVLGVVGALVGGFICNAIGHSALTGINLCSIFVAFIGEVVVLLLYHMVFRRRGRQTPPGPKPKGFSAR